MQLFFAEVVIDGISAQRPATISLWVAGICGFSEISSLAEGCQYQMKRINRFSFDILQQDKRLVSSVLHTPGLANVAIGNRNHMNL